MICFQEGHIFIFFKVGVVNTIRGPGLVIDARDDK
jgi:hypothetical protein